MLTVQDIEKASELIKLRERIVRAKWDVVAVGPQRPGQYMVTDFEPFDDELAFAVEKYRGRRIAAIDEKLKALGVDPTKASVED